MEEDGAVIKSGEKADGKASGFTPSSLKLVEEENGFRYLQLNGHLGEVFMCLWNPVQQQLATGSADGMCRLWGLWNMTPEKWASEEANVLLKTAIMPHSQSEGEKFKDVTSITWSPDGKFLATGCYDGMARIWDNQGKFVRQLKEHTGPVFSLKWSRDGKYILSGSYDRRAIVWDAAGGGIVKVFLLHTGPVLDVDWRDCDSFATCSSDRNIYICQASSTGDNVPLRCLTGHEDEVNAVCWSPGGHMLASCSDDRYVPPLTHHPLSPTTHPPPTTHLAT
ncbi:WD40-repeat-containing domain protein, partial [Ochromonadaceae sp. CCMP2298]